MTTYYVDSHGSNTAPYDTWAKAATTLAVIAAIDAAGDIIYVAHNHAEATAGAISYAWAGINTDPTRIICGNTAAQPPTSVATTATIENNTSGNLTFNSASGAYIYWYGIIFNVAVGTAGANSFTSSGSVNNYFFEQCSIRLVGTGVSALMFVIGSQGRALFKDCTFKFGHVDQSIQVGTTFFLHINGGSLLSGGSSPTTLLTQSSNAVSHTLIENFDLSNAAATINLGHSSTAKGTFRNCKLPSSWSGLLCVTRPILGRWELNNTDATNTNYRLWIQDFYGDITHETTLTLTGGANNGTTGISWKFVTTTAARFQNPLASCEIAEWNSVVGSPITATIEILHDSATNLKDDEVWLELQYLSSSGAPLGAFVSDAKANILATAADQTASSETWTTTGMSNPNKQKLSVTFTSQMEGVVHAVVKVAKASYTIYVDPKLTIS